VPFHWPRRCRASLPAVVVWLDRRSYCRSVCTPVRMRTDYWYSTSGPSCWLLGSVELPLKSTGTACRCVRNQFHLALDASDTVLDSSDVRLSCGTVTSPIVSQSPINCSVRALAERGKDLSRHLAVAILVSTRYCFA